MQCGQNVQFLNVKLLVHHVSSGLWKVNARHCSLRRQYLWLGRVPVLAGIPARLTVFALLFSVSPGWCQTRNFKLRHHFLFSRHFQCIVHHNSFSRRKCFEVLRTSLRQPVFCSSTVFVVFVIMIIIIFQIEFSTECDLVFPLSTSGIPWFP
jgi:hypothetical protein